MNKNKMITAISSEKMVGTYSDAPCDICNRISDGVVAGSAKGLKLICNKCYGSVATRAKKNIID